MRIQDLYKRPEQNKLFTQNVRMGLDGRKHRRNLNTVVIGGSDAGRSFNLAKPNLMQANTSFVVLDPKGELVRDYEIRTEHGLRASSLVLLEQIRTIDKHRLENKIGRLSPKQIKELNHALVVSVGLIDPRPRLRKAPFSCAPCILLTMVDSRTNFAKGINLGHKGKFERKIKKHIDIFL